MSDTKAEGVSRTEELLSRLCARSFLCLWSYANPHKDDGKEFCDVIAIFDDHIFIFFDREKPLAEFAPNENPTIRWERWKRAVIDKQIVTANGAERYLRSGRQIFLDAKKTKPLPIKIDLRKATIHKIIVAHGAAEACKKFSASNVYGSLAITYSAKMQSELSKFPFSVHLDKNDPIHVLDSHTLPIILGELDTVKDFSDYLDAKIAAISSLSLLSYCGEEDLLANYWRNLDTKTGRHFIGVTGRSDHDALFVGEGDWQELIEGDQYRATKRANQLSYFWDRLIDRTCNNWLQGKLLGDADLLARPNAIVEMAKEPRFMRRLFTTQMIEAVNNFPEDKNGIIRHMRFFNSYYEDKAYVFLQLWVPENKRKSDDDYRAKRKEILKIACGAAMNEFPQMRTIIGIAIEPPKKSGEGGEDFVWLDCEGWTNEQKREIDRANAGLGFFKTGNLQRRKYTEFVSAKKRPTQPRPSRPGRNAPCPCGSGKKFKRCHGL